MLWRLLMRTYEYLWKLKRGTLATALKLHTPTIDADASLTASLIRSYSRQWLEGGGWFAALLYPYLLEEKEYQKARASIRKHLDAEYAGQNGGIAGGLAEIDDEAIRGRWIHERKRTPRELKIRKHLRRGDLARQMEAETVPGKGT